MLKTNSKQARENIKKYIMDNFEGTNYEIEQPETFAETAKIIYQIFKAEKHDNRPIAEQALFEDWASGLPSILDTCYYYNRSAVDDLGDILEQTETERNRYTEEEAEKMLTYLIYREITKEV